MIGLGSDKKVFSSHIGVQISTFIAQKQLNLKSRLKEEGCSNSSIKDEATHHKDRQHPAL